MELRERLATDAFEEQSAPDPFAQLKNRVHREVIAELGPRLFDRGASASVMRAEVAAAVRARLAAEPGLSRVERERLEGEVADDILGYGPIERLLADPTISEIMVNGAQNVFIERDGWLERTDLRFDDDSHLRRIINKMVAEVGRRIDESSPMVDARLPDGSRVNATIAPLSLSGPLLTIRKFAHDRFDLDDLVRIGTLSPATRDFLERCVRARLNILVTGGTGTGKTTLLNALSAAIPDEERIITVEDAAELRMRQAHVLRLESRPKNIEGEGEVTIRDLVRNSLRMRPDRIVVGEVRGAEALDMLQAMNTGHDGSLSTVHCNSPRDALARVETMVLMSGFDLPVRAIRGQVASALELIVHLERLEDGSRRVTAITEVLRMEGDVVTIQDLYSFHLEEVLPDRTVVGDLRSCGLRPTFGEKFRKHGVEMPRDVYAVPDGLALPEGRLR